jgi:hypothetical protein
MVETQIRHDAVDPGVERALKPEAADVDVSAQEGFLVDVLAVFLRASEMNRQPEYGPVVLANQFFKSGGIAELCSADELRVIYPSCSNLLPMLDSKL